MLSRKEMTGIIFVILDFMEQGEAGLPQTEWMTRNSLKRDIRVQRNWKQKEQRKGIPNKTLQGRVMLVLFKVLDTGPAEI